jgi:hypothetical protein
MPAPKAAPLLTGPLDALYISQQKRDTHDKTTDVFVSLPQEVADSFNSGENCQVIFHTNKNSLRANYVIVEDQYLYPNFYVFNEKGIKPFEENRKILEIMFDVSGEGSQIKHCIPAKVIQRSDGYIIISKGKLVLGE